MDYATAIEFLYGLRLFGTKLGLENAFALARLCGDPQRHLRFIHVAGTNGKGSVCAILESIYRHAGLRVGLFTSPHLVSFTERIQVNRSCIPEQDVSRLIAELLSHLGPKREEWPLRPTFFEFVTVLALLYFQEQQCDLVIWETGLGGRLDATNIVTPVASVITNIQFDHQQWLGHTLAEIASEKAGIIKPNVPLITAVEAGEALDVIKSVAARLLSPLTWVNTIDARLSPESLPLRGEHQKINASVALATIDALQDKTPVPESAILDGLANTCWAGRFQEVHLHGSTLVLDGAHNPDGARALSRALDDLFPGREGTLVLGLFKDKAWREMCDLLVPGAARVFLTPLESDRTVLPEEVQSYCAQRWPHVEIVASPSSASATDQALQFPFVIVAGSLHLIGEVMQHLGLGAFHVSERDLNEWDATRTEQATAKNS